MPTKAELANPSKAHITAAYEHVFQAEIKLRAVFLDSAASQAKTAAAVLVDLKAAVAELEEVSL